MSSLLRFHIDAHFRLSTDWVRLRFEPGDGPRAFLREEAEGQVVVLPAGFPLERPAAQAWANRVVVELLRRRALAVLPQRLDDAARRFGLRYRRLTVKNVCSRWGSCSADGNINLSLWLMLLPTRFVDYVVVHELAHLVERNHGPRFWATVDRFLGQPGAGHRTARELNAYFRDYCRTVFRAPIAAR